VTSYLGQANTGADALATTRAVTKPGGVAAGAVGVFWLVRWETGGSFPAVTPPAGAVLRGTITNGTEQTLCYLHRVAAETTYTYSWTGGRWSALSALWFDGVDPALDLATTPFQSTTGTGTSITTLTLTTVNTAALVWNVSTIATSGVTHTPPTSFTEIADVSPWSSAYRISPADGSQSASGATLNISSPWAVGLVALAPAASDTSQALTTAAETDAAQPLSAAKSAPIVFAAASETALPVQGVKTVTPAMAQSLEAAQPLAGSKSAILGAASTAEAAQPLSGAKTATLPPAVEQSTAQVLTGVKASTLDTAGTAETAQSLTAAAAAPLPTASTTEAAQPLIGVKTATLTPALEVSTARPLTAQSAVTPSPARTVHVPAQRRTLVVAAEHRTLTVR
jgi:hypothetical protein